MSVYDRGRRTSGSILTIDSNVNVTVLELLELELEDVNNKDFVQFENERTSFFSKLVHFF